MTANSAESVRWENLYRQLGPAFHTAIRPAPLNNARLVHLNAELAGQLRLDGAHAEQLLRQFNGETPLDGREPLASLYAGHQFGSWVSQLGDGRAALIGQRRDAAGQLWDIQSKGCGPTPYSRHADGRAVLRSCIREYLCSESMHGLGIPTTRALALLDSDTPVYREQVERGAILVRVAESHLRFGHFEVFASRQQKDEVRVLADYLLAHHFAHLADVSDPYLALYREVLERSADLMAQWQAVGFCHGVMNTDNMSILGLTLDYGPFGFMEEYDPAHICNHSDFQGRYAYQAQPRVAHWNLACLGQALLDLIDFEAAQAVLQSFPARFADAYQRRMAPKLGLSAQDPELEGLLNGWLNLLAAHRVDFTLAFRRLAELAAGDALAEAWLEDALQADPAWQLWRENYLRRLRVESGSVEKRVQAMFMANPLYILRNAFAQRAIERAEHGDYGEINRLFHLLRHPYQAQADGNPYENPAPQQERHLAVSCSS